MGLITLNRYITIVKPALHSKLFPSKRTARLYCVLVWLVALLLSTPLYGWGKFAYHTKFLVYTFSWEGKYISYTVLIACVNNGVTTAILYCYYKIYKTVKESTQNMHAHGDQNRVDTSNSNRADIKLLKTSFTVVCVFVVTWSPVVNICYLPAGRSV